MSSSLKALRFMLLVILTVFGCTARDPPLEDSGDAFEDPDLEALYQVVASNGFTYPLDSVSSWSNGNYAACGSSHYWSGLCHTGNDIAASQGTDVYSLAAGTVIYQSGTQNTSTNCPSGWGYDYGYNSTCNMAIMVQYYDDDGNPFVVLYGHLRYSTAYRSGTGAVSPGVAVSPGQVLGQIGRYYNTNGTAISGDHLHFGVYPGTTAPTSNLGRTSCATSQPPGTSYPAGCSANGTTAPGTFLGAAGRNWVAPPQAPVLTGPANGAVTSLPMGVFWSNGSGTYRTHVMICTNAALTAGCFNPDGDMVGVEPTGVGASRATSYGPVLAAGTYYWAVRGIAYNDYGGWGSYSSVRSFTVQ